MIDQGTAWHLENNVNHSRHTAVSFDLIFPCSPGLQWLSLPPSELASRGQDLFVRIFAGCLYRPSIGWDDSDGDLLIFFDPVLNVSKAFLRQGRVITGYCPRTG